MKKAFRLLTGLAAAALAVSAVPAEEDSRSKALEILREADAAAKAVKAVRYTGHTKPSGIAENFVSAAEGEGIMVGWLGNLPEKFWAHVKTTQPGSDEPVELTGGGDGDTFFIINHQEKKAYEDMDPAVMGSKASTLQNFGMAELVHATPFDDELSADELEYQGIETVGDVKCHKIYVVYAGGRQKSTWFFSTDDLLPRRRIRYFSIPEQGEGSLEITLARLEVDPDIDPAVFKLKLPEGYEQVDDFAP